MLLPMLTPCVSKPFSKDVATQDTRTVLNWSDNRIGPSLCTTQTESAVQFLFDLHVVLGFAPPWGPAVSSDSDFWNSPLVDFFL